MSTGAVLPLVRRCWICRGPIEPTDPHLRAVFEPERVRPVYACSVACAETPMLGQPVAWRAV